MLHPFCKVFCSVKVIHVESKSEAGKFGHQETE